MRNVWDKALVTIRPGTKARWLSDDGGSGTSVCDDTAVYEVREAMACHTMNGGGSQLTMVDPNWPEYKVLVHSSKVTRVQA